MLEILDSCTELKSQVFMNLRKLEICFLKVFDESEGKKIPCKIPNVHEQSVCKIHTTYRLIKILWLIFFLTLICSGKVRAFLSEAIVNSAVGDCKKNNCFLSMFELSRM